MNGLFRGSTAKSFMLEPLKHACCFLPLLESARHTHDSLIHTLWPWSKPCPDIYLKSGRKCSAYSNHGGQHIVGDGNRHGHLWSCRVQLAFRGRRCDHIVDTYWRIERFGGDTSELRRTYLKHPNWDSNSRLIDRLTAAIKYWSYQARFAAALLMY